ncbi:MAG TPA: NADPH-dependent assimilatory sulfite reductase hemoprotein subunit [Balneolales bacterium]|nr:NADPH-dependent assimilatory sulfite reductase hemoprotein subunit [Balneolales bacterium]
MSDTEKKKSKLEKIKENSHFLRGDIAEELQNDNPYFSKSGLQLLKFHGTYQQDDRDARKGKDRHYMFMIRIRLPGGKMTSDQYVALDDVANHFSWGTLRLTTRQTIQFHGILKGDLKKTIQNINKTLITTLGACGDIVRNVMCNPAPDTEGKQAKIQEYADFLSGLLLPETHAYHELWLDGEKIYSNREEINSEESLYGDSYLPRKFKIGITAPGDNSIDLYTQDIGLVAIFDEQNEIKGFNVIVGGGMGMNHKKKNTFPRLGDHLGYISKDKLVQLVTNIIEIQRDHGDRGNRKHARMKYLIHDWGFDRFKEEVEKRVGFKLDPFIPLPKFELDLYLGWNMQADGNWYLGLSIENGRIKDDDQLKLKSGLRETIKKYDLNVRLTPNQNLLLTDISESQKDEIEQELRKYGIQLPGELSNALKFSMACPALPTCGLAIAESERVMPDVIRELEKVLRELGLENEKLTVRMTGCPNGCARPYVADIGFVGRSLNQYSVFIGGDPAGTRLNKRYKDRVQLENLVSTVRPLLEQYKEERQADEAFSDYWNRVGLESIEEVVTN